MFVYPNENPSVKYTQNGDIIHYFGYFSNYSVDIGDTYVEQLVARIIEELIQFFVSSYQLWMEFAFDMMLSP